MLQIIGWLGCVMLFVYCARLTLSPDYRAQDGSVRKEAKLIVWVGMGIAVLFAILLWIQGTTFEDIPSVSSDQEMADVLNDCLTNSANPQNC